MSMFIVASMIWVLATYAGLHPPGGYNADAGTHVMAITNPAAFQVFLVADMVAVLASVSVWVMVIKFMLGSPVIRRSTIFKMTSIAVIAMTVSCVVAVATVGSYTINPLAIYWVLIFFYLREAGVAYCFI